MPGVAPLSLQAEAVLDPTIQFGNPLSEFVQTPTAILLTGATGFLGAHLLDELLRQTTANIYCLVRSSDTQFGQERLKKALQFYSLWQETYCCRIIPVVGDLSQPLLGLTEQQFYQLAQVVDIIYHNGALVNASYPYSELKAINVLGTQEILRFASSSQTKPVHFISSIAVFFSPLYLQAGCIQETDMPECESGLKGGYKQSKWVAERLVMLAQARGLPACIYRPERILGHSKTGIIGNFDDLLCSLLQACIRLGKFPILETNVNVVPVDYVSQAIVYLSLQPPSVGRVFHLTNPQPIPWRNLLSELHALGYPLTELPYQVWFAALKAYTFAHRERTLQSLLLVLLSSASVLKLKKPEMSCRHTLEGLAGSSIICPAIDSQLLSTYFSYFQKSGYIPIPSVHSL